MIERLLAADGALGRGELEVAERLFRQVADADARNAIAHVGLARIAVRRGDIDSARASLGQALEIDPDEAAARRLLLELDSGVEPEPAPEPEAAPAPVPAPVTAPVPAPVPAPAPAPVPAPVPASVPASQAPARRRSLIERIRRWLGLSGGRG